MQGVAPPPGIRTYIHTHLASLAELGSKAMCEVVCAELHKRARLEGKLDPTTGLAWIAELRGTTQSQGSCH